MADLRGFSSLAEELPAEQVVRVINNFLGAMTEIIVDSGGTIDEFIGDAILVFFGAPTPRDDHARAAVECALRMQLEMEGVRQKNRSEGLPMVEMGIGIHSGEVVVGNIGSEKRTKYGAVGSAVNLAGRIESTTVGGQILISGATRELAGPGLLVNTRLDFRPKGFGEVVTLFDVNGLEGDGEIRLLRQESRPSVLTTPVSVRFSVLDGKLASLEMQTGELVAVGSVAAVLRTDVALEALADIELLIEDSSGTRPLRQSRPIYAKVSGSGSRHGEFEVRFTSIGADVRSWLQQLTG